MVGMFTLCALLLVSQGVQGEYRMRVNDERVIDGRSVANVSIGSEAIASAKLSRDQRTLIITALSPGTTTLTITYRTGRRRVVRIVVYALEVKKVAREIKQMLRGMEGVAVRVMGEDQIRLDGAVYAERDLARIEKISAFYGGALLNLVELDPRYVQAVRLVELEFNFAEIRRTQSGSWGINWFNGQIAAVANPNLNIEYSDPANMGNDLITNAALTVTGEFPLEIDYLTARGWATTHDTHRVVVGDGSEGRYEAGGQLNIQVAGNVGGAVETIPFGTLIKLKPRLGRDDMVELGIEAEVSDLDFTSAVGGVPSLRTNRISSKVVLKLTETLALTGLIRRQDSSDRSGIIGLNRIPILGYFFSSEDWLKSRTEAVLFITPRLVKAGTPAQSQAVDRVLSRIIEFADEDF